MVFGEHYDCIYEASGKGGETLDNLNCDLLVNLSHHACFARIYEQIRSHKFAEVTYKIYLFKEDLPDKNFNLCDKNETKKILRCLQKTVPFSYKFEQGQFTKSTYCKDVIDYNVLNVTIRGNYAQHLWVTSLLRCFFEWPYNIAAKEACILQSEIKEVDGLDLARENWINLYLTIAAQLGSYGLHGVVDLGTHPKAKTYHEWKQKLASMHGNGRIIDRLREGGGNFSRHVEKINIYNQQILDQGTKSRASKYVAAYKDKLSWKNQ